MTQFSKRKNAYFQGYLMTEHSLMLYSCVMLVFEKFYTRILNNNNSLKQSESII